MVGGTLIAGLGAIALGGVFAIWRVGFLHGLVVCAVGSALVALAGFTALATGSSAVGAGFTSAFHPALGVDGLSGVFLGTLGLVAAPVLIFMTRSLESDVPGRAIAGLTALFLLTLSFVLCARDPLTFLAGWE